MADTRKRRGPHPKDRKLFAERHHLALREAVSDFSWLLNRGYGEKSALTLVGDRLKLRERQRIAVGRVACSDAERDARQSRRLPLDSVRERDLYLDGFNLLTTIEAALAGGILLRGRDGCIRDMASMHGNYRVLDDTEVAVDLVFLALRRLRARKVIWYLDKPVSNSGNLAAVIRGIAKDYPEFTSDVRLVKDPDPLLARLKGDDSVIATADSGILDRCGSWINLIDYVITVFVAELTILDFIRDSESIETQGASRQTDSVIRKVTPETDW